MGRGWLRAGRRAPHNQTRANTSYGLAEADADFAWLSAASGCERRHAAYARCLHAWDVHQNWTSIRMLYEVWPPTYFNLKN